MERFRILGVEMAKPGTVVAGPFSSSPVVVGRIEACFTGPLYTIWTETLDAADGGSGDNVFDAVILGNQRLFKAVQNGHSPAYTITPTEISKLMPGDNVLSLPAYIHGADAKSKTISFRNQYGRAMVVRISNVMKRMLTNAPALQVSFGNAVGVIADGISFSG
jgi:hypothetical protein